MCALGELMATLVYCSFKAIKEEFPLRERQTPPSPKISSITHSSLSIFNACLTFLKANIHNRALENYDTIYRLWLTLMRHYPTLYQQQIYSLPLGETNDKLIQLFREEWGELEEEESLLLMEIVEEYLLTELMDLAAEEVRNIIGRAIGEAQSEDKRVRVVLASASLYFSFALLKHHSIGTTFPT